jgi:hypothetical protein
MIRYTQQCRGTFGAFNGFLRQVNPVRIVEIGTGRGGLTQFLANFAPVRTYDIIDRRQVSAGDFRLQDAFADEGLIPYLQLPGTTLLLCDGGNKILEWNTFAPMIKHSDYIMAHDYAPHRKRNGYPLRSGIEIWDDVISFDGLEKCYQHFKAVAWLCCRKRND